MKVVSAASCWLRVLVSSPTTTTSVASWTPAPAQKIGESQIAASRPADSWVAPTTPIAIAPRGNASTTGVPPPQGLLAA
jgi:hypothetical protein